MRVGAAGSLTVLVSESSFYWLDAINAKSKMLRHNLGLFEMAPKVLYEEGAYGFFKGYSSTYYSTMYSGFVYFYVYKALKNIMNEKYKPKG